MPVIGMTINKQQKEELKAIVREMCLTQFAHPQDPNVLSTFLPPGAGVGTLVQIAVEQYVTYFRRLKAEAMAAAQQQAQAQPQPQQQGQLSTAQAVAQAAVNRSKTLRNNNGQKALKGVKTVPEAQPKQPAQEVISPTANPT